MLPRPRPFKPGRLDKFDRPMPDEAPALGGCRNGDDSDDGFCLGLGFVLGAPALGTAVVLLMAFKNRSEEHTSELQSPC